MKKALKKIWLIAFGILLTLLTPLSVTFANNTAPTIENDYFKALTSDWWGEKLYEIKCVSSKNTLKQNISCLFFPKTNWGGVLWGIWKYAGMVLVFIFIVYAAANLIISQGKPEKMKEAVSSLLYILIWSLLFFWSMWIFWSNGPFDVLSLQQTSWWLKSVEANLTGEKWLLFFLLSFLKWAAFFIAIVMIVVTWFKLMNPHTWEGWDGKKLAKSLINIIFALVWMKVVDFLYLIASQEKFATRAGDFIIQVMKFLAYVSGSVMVIMLIYAWYLLIIDGGKGDNFKKAKTIMINMVLAVIALFFFLFILYQIFSEFWGTQ